MDTVARTLVDAAFEVHSVLGPGYLEEIYENALCAELEMRGVPFERQRAVSVIYKGRPVGVGRLDLLVAGLLVVELKAVAALSPLHLAQTLAYLKALERELGLLINFNVPVLKRGIHRVIRTTP